MTASAPISFNAGAESGDRVSANTSCWFALRRRTEGRPIAPVAPAIRILIALPSQLALRRLKGGALVHIASSSWGILSAASLAIGVRPTSRLLALKPGGKGQTTAEPPSVAQN